MANKPLDTETLCGMAANKTKPVVIVDADGELMSNFGDDARVLSLLRSAAEQVEARIAAERRA